MGCGSGLPITKVLIDEGLNVSAIDGLVVWNDAMTGLESRSLGAAAYRTLLSSVGLSVISEYEDEGQNYYFDALKKPHMSPCR